MNGLRRARGLIRQWVSDAPRGLGVPAIEDTPIEDAPIEDEAPPEVAEPVENWPRYLVAGGWRTEQKRLLDYVTNAPFDPQVIPSKLLAEWWPEIARTKAVVSMDTTEWWALPYGERTVIDALVRYLRPRIAFEFGTFMGATTALIADAAPPGAVIHTIDIPPEAFEQEGFAEAYEAKGGAPAELLGSRFRDRDDASNSIIFHRAYSEDFDYAPLRGKVDFILVDASHEYDDVLRESERALEMLSPWGVIVWDDYDWFQPGVVQALNELGARVELCHVASTRLVVHRRRGFELPADFDDEAVDIVRAVHPYTLTGPERVVALRDAVDYVTRAAVPGAIVECGVYRGGSMMAVAKTLVARGDTGRHLYLFDTFTSMPPAGDRDVDIWGRSGRLWADTANSHPDWSYLAPGEVEDLMVGAGYDRELVHVVPGLVEDTVPAEAPDEIALLRLDTDWYQSTAHEMEHLFPRVADGGVVIIDDYGYFLGAQEAVDEYFESRGMTVLLHRIDDTGRALVVRRQPPA
jgi:O-methyltransferase